MPYYYSTFYRQVVHTVEPKSQPYAAGEVSHERVPALIDTLDCLLTLWVAEAMLDTGPWPSDRP